MTLLPETAEVLIWLPGATEPVLAGVIQREWRCLSFTYDRAYLTQGKPISICARDLKMKFQSHHPQEPHVLARALRDPLPDRWGRRALAAILSDAGGRPILEDEIDEMQVMLLTGPDHIGALEFRAPGKRTRSLVVSALSWTLESELSAHHISYEQLAGHIEDSFERAREAQREMVTRLVFNVLVGNTDDHARNHAAFWTGDTRELTPAYDIAPQRRTSREVNQAMTLANGTRAAQLQNVAVIAPTFGVTALQFQEVVDQLVGTIVDHWSVVYDEAGLSRAEQAGFAGRQFLNEYAFDGYGPVPHLFARG